MPFSLVTSPWRNIHFPLIFCTGIFLTTQKKLESRIGPIKSSKIFFPMGISPYFLNRVMTFFSYGDFPLFFEPSFGKNFLDQKKLELKSYGHFPLFFEPSYEKKFFMIKKKLESFLEWNPVQKIRQNWIFSHRVLYFINFFFFCIPHRFPFWLNRVLLKFKTYLGTC